MTSRLKVRKGRIKHEQSNESLMLMGVLEFMHFVESTMWTIQTHVCCPVRHVDWTHTCGRVDHASSSAIAQVLLSCVR